MSRIVWVIDASYLMKSKPAHFDYLKLKNVLEKECGGEFAESFYLNSVSSPPTDTQNSFHTWLKLAPPQGPQMRIMLYKYKYAQIECPACCHQYNKEIQKGVDVGIATLIVKLAAQNRYSRLVLSTGDGDFEDAIAYAKDELHKEIWITGFKDTISPDLQSYSDRVLWLEDYWEDFKK